jgi:transposase
MEITTIGVDLAKSIFQVHGVDATGQVVIRKSLRRAQMLPFFARLPSCLVGMEACGTSHHWAAVPASGAGERTTRRGRRATTRKGSSSGRPKHGSSLGSKETDSGRSWLI